MPKKLVRLGRVKGYRPTRSQMEELLELAQRGIAETSKARLICRIGEEQIYPHGKPNKIGPEHLSEIIADADDPAELTNVEFFVEHASTLLQSIGIFIGPGDWVEYRVESDDQTWALGRYHELTDKFLTDRSLYAKRRAPGPEMLGRDDRWRPLAWDMTLDPRGWLVVTGIALLWAIWLVDAVLLAVIGLSNYSPSGNSHQTSRHKNNPAVSPIHLTGHSAVLLVGLTITYLVILIAVQRWLFSLLKSKIILRKTSLLYQFSFQNKKTDVIGLASFYVAVLTLIVTVVTWLIH